MDIETRNPYRQAQFIGIDNRNPETKTKAGYVRDLLNVDPTRDGQFPRRRAGYASAFHAGSRVHSAWGDGLFPWLLWVDDGVLYGVQHKGDMPTPLLTGLSGERMSYAAVNSEVYFSNGEQSGLIRMDGEVYPWACEVPNGQPNGNASASTGRQVAVTYRDMLGRESGTGRATIISGDVVTGIPQPQTFGIVAVRIYASEPDGDVLYHALDVPVGITSATLPTKLKGKALATQFHEPLPAGHMVSAAHGRLFVARDKTLYWSEALRYGQGVLAENYIRFESRISLMAAVGDGTGGAGVLIADAERTYFLGGADPDKWVRPIVYPHGAVEGVQACASGEVWGMETTVPVPSWLAKNGQFCVGLPGGQVAAYNANVCSTDTADIGAALIRDVDGQRHMLASMLNSRQGAGISDKWSVEVRRNGVVLP